ncbi:hypothetical protein MJH12_19525 [bacterium]|nr:hypothetical protein [bacterium]
MKIKILLAISIVSVCFNSFANESLVDRIVANFAIEERLEFVYQKHSATFNLKIASALKLASTTSFENIIGELQSIGNTGFSVQNSLVEFKQSLLSSLNTKQTSSIERLFVSKLYLKYLRQFRITFNNPMLEVQLISFMDSAVDDYSDSAMETITKIIEESNVVDTLLVEIDQNRQLQFNLKCMLLNKGSSKQCKIQKKREDKLWIKRIDKIRGQLGENQFLLKLFLLRDFSEKEVDDLYILGKSDWFKSESLITKVLLRTINMSFANLSNQANVFYSNLSK